MDVNFDFNFLGRMKMSSSVLGVIMRNRIHFLYITLPFCFLFGLRLMSRLIGLEFIQIVLVIILYIRE